MPDLLPWSVRTFGATNAATLAKALREALRRAHARALSAHTSGGLVSNDLYGTGLALAQHEELLQGVADTGIEGAGHVKVLRFRFAKIGEHVFYPVRYADAATVEFTEAQLRQPVSELRRTLFTRFAPKLAQASLYDELDPADWGTVDDVKTFGLGEDTKIVTVGYAANPNAGVLRMFWGEASLADQARLTWHDHDFEEIPMLLDADQRAKSALHAVPRGQVQRTFAEGVEPTVELGVRHEEEATGDNA